MIKLFTYLEVKNNDVVIKTDMDMANSGEPLTEDSTKNEESILNCFNSQNLQSLLEMVEKELEKLP